MHSYVPRCLLGFLLIFVWIGAPLANGLKDVTVRAWHGAWITGADAPAKEVCALRFRKLAHLASVAVHFIVHVSADNQFVLHVNGQFVGTGPSRGDIGHWRYETYDIGPFLHAGENVVAATVWNDGQFAPVRQISNRIGFLLDGDSQQEAAFDSDNSWLVEIEQGHSTLPTPRIHNSYYVAAPSERIDGKRLDWDWDKVPSSGDSTAFWKHAVVISHAASRGARDMSETWQLVPDQLPPMDIHQEALPKLVRSSGVREPGGFPAGRLVIMPHTEASILLDQGYLTTAYPHLTISHGDHAKVTMTYAEALFDAEGNKGNRNDLAGRHIEGISDEFLPSGDMQKTFSPFLWKAWRYVEIQVRTEDAPIELEGFDATFTGYPFHQSGVFHSDDASLSNIWEIGWRTARLCAHDTYMDTPYWEQLQYTGDTRVQALISYTVAGDDRLARQAIQAFHDSLLPEGITQSHYPANAFQSIPGYSLYWIGMVHDFWMYRDDAEFVRDQLSVVRSTLDWFRHHQNRNHLMGRLPWWPFVDYTPGFKQGVPPQDAQGNSAILTLQFIEALRYAAAMEEALGNKALAAQDTHDADRISGALLKLCWNNKHRLLADTPEQTAFSQHANSYAVWLDVVPRALQRGVMEKILQPRGSLSITQASYYYRFYVTRAMAHVGLGDRYVKMLTPWKDMAALGLTTWAETPEPTRSDSHAWSAHPNYDLLTVVAGISPASAGFKTVHIEPKLGGLRHVDATMPTPMGLMRVSYDLSAAGLKTQVAMPSGMRGDFTWHGRRYALHAGTQSFALGAAH